MVGIKGTGMSALAVNLKQMGIKVSGSDYTESFFTDALLAKHRIRVSSPFAASNVPASANLVVVSTAYDNKNPEVAEAKRRGLSIMTYPEALGLLTKQLQSVAVCGSHGKTTTSAALGYVMSGTGYRPIVNVGSIIPQLASYQARNPKLLVFEADEYQDKFRYFYPKIIIITNIDYDHPDYFRSPAHYKSVFRKFVSRIPRNGLLIYCADDKNCRDVAKNAKCRKISYGFSKYAYCRILVDKINPAKTNFSTHLVVELLSGSGQSNNAYLSNLYQLSSSTTKFEAGLIGNHNALNLTAAALCAAALGIPTKQIQKSIAAFTGTKRRLEITRHLRINGHDCIVIDDFAHHPTEIKATLAAVRAAYSNKTIWTIFQPHTFSRTKALFDDFAKCFNKSDKTIILDIYGSKREVTGAIHSRDLVRKIKKNAYYQPTAETAAKFLKKEIKKPSIILTLGASEIWRLANLL